MPGPLMYYKRDPQRGKKRGAGHYYHRGRGVYSKKDDKRDRRYKAKGFRGLPRKIGSGVYRHTHDRTGKKARMMGKKRPRAPKRRKNPGRKTTMKKCRYCRRKSRVPFAKKICPKCGRKGLFTK